ncbi:Gastrula zinc finger protein XlCGF8.2DB [Mizuhopecten yessoensis]|uniref:Gastrula zinc finger protein XlCGF8.2DB n=1 Tax=Mizuhopecten yessoensis TaxID=6573 RepID=A0A210Q3E5_MIZYE|nr:Gastrula zinc finger protein XlCGF8.2DB [Mizuhopecten yessoensis]
MQQKVYIDDNQYGFSHTGVDVHGTKALVPSGIGMKRFICGKCGKAFSTKQNLQFHDIAQHTGSYRFKCQHCKKGFTKKYLLDQHLMRHANIRTEFCTVCGRGFFSKYTLHAHMKKCSTNFPK